MYMNITSGKAVLSPSKVVYRANSLWSRLESSIKKPITPRRNWILLQSDLVCVNLEVLSDHVRR